LQNAGDANQGVSITVPLPTPSYLPVTSGDPGVNPSGAWFISNQWYRQTYYAVSPGFVPGGVPPGNPAACNPLPSSLPLPTRPCLKVNNLPSSYATRNDKQAILVFTGRALNGSSRPSGTPANYLESANLAAANATPVDYAFYVYEHRAGVPTAINDRVVVVSPPLP